MAYTACILYPYGIDSDCSARKHTVHTFTVAPTHTLLRHSISALGVAAAMLVDAELAGVAALLFSLVAIMSLCRSGVGKDQRDHS